MTQEQPEPLFPWEGDAGQPEGPETLAAASDGHGADEGAETAVVTDVADGSSAGEVVAEDEAGGVAVATDADDVRDPSDDNDADPEADAAAAAEHAAVRTELLEAGARVMARERPVARREYFSISEVCDLVGLKPHVLRYWETQFGVLNPSKNRSGNRVYQRKEIRLILLVKTLLYEEKYTVDGARAKLEQMRKGGELHEATGRVLDRHMVQVLKTDLQELLGLLSPPRG
jgi:DNA-binding transcriptional MerR regulator